MRAMTNANDQSVPVLLEHADFVRRLARGLVRDPATADDVVQETWIAALERPPRSAGAARSWFRTTVQHVSAKMRRGEGRRVTRERAGARPEAERPTDEIVERLALQRRVVDAVLALREPYRRAIVLRYFEELRPLEIARREAVPLNTVRSRLRRGLERIRADLDRASGGDRTAWTSVFLPLVRLEPAAASGVNLPLASGWSLMNVKSLCATLVVAILGTWVVTGLWTDDSIDVARRTSTSTGTKGDAAHDDATSSAAEPNRVAARSTLVREEVRTDDEAETALALVAAESASGPTGAVTFRVYDAESGDPLAVGVDARLMSETRFAEASRSPEDSDPIELRLTPDTYEGGLLARGHEPRPIGPFVVDADRTTDLGYVGLTRGRGVIEGRVHARWLDPKTEIRIDLRGNGRSPCPACHAAVPVESAPAADAPAFDPWDREAPCDTCGYSKDRSRLSCRGPGPGTFRFEGLASGPYHAHVFTDEDPIGRSLVVDLIAGGSQFLEFVLAPPLAVRFDVVDAEGRRFPDGVTEHDARQPVVFFVHQNGRLVLERQFVSVLLSGPSDDVRVHLALRHLRLHDGDALSGIPILRYIRQLHPLTVSSDSSRSDRPRRPEDSLWPPAHLPEIAHEKGVHGHVLSHPYVVEPLPSDELEVLVFCGDWQSERVRVDLRRGDPGIVRIVLRPRSELGDDAPERPSPDSFPATDAQGVFHLGVETAAIVVTAGDSDP